MEPHTDLGLCPCESVQRLHRKSTHFPWRCENLLPLARANIFHLLHFTSSFALLYTTYPETLIFKPPPPIKMKSSEEH